MSNVPSTPLGCVFSVCVWIYIICMTASTGFFAHTAWHLNPDPNVGNLLLDFILVPLIKGILWPFFL